MRINSGYCDECVVGTRLCVCVCGKPRGDVVDVGEEDRGGERGPEQRSLLLGCD